MPAIPATGVIAKTLRQSDTCRSQPPTIGPRAIAAPVMRSGVPLMAEPKPGDAVRSHWLAGALGALLSDREPEQPPITIELRTGDEPIVLETRDGRIETRLGAASDPDATVAGEPTPILGLLFGALDLDAAKAAGVELTGAPAALERVRAGRLP